MTLVDHFNGISLLTNNDMVKPEHHAEDALNGDSLLVYRDTYFFSTYSSVSCHSSVCSWHSVCTMYIYKANESTQNQLVDQDH